MSLMMLQPVIEKNYPWSRLFIKKIFFFKIIKDGSISIWIFYKVSANDI
jgi:hypothetical protein